MKKIELLKEELIKKGVKFETGLSKQEIIEVERVYNINFPTEYEEFLKEGVPVSNGFYNWRDLSPKNISYIKEKMNIPFIDILNYCGEIDEWPSAWGTRPKNSQDLKRKIEMLLNEAPRLIPVYAHRYIPMLKEESPVLSVMGLDIIYYGQNLFQYLEIEFGRKNYNEIAFENIGYIEFWSDTINF